MTNTVGEVGATHRDPGQYRRFAGARLHPALDLMDRIAVRAPQRIVDLGCGTGGVTRILAERWPGAEVTSIDASPEMLAAARAAPSRIRWRPRARRAWWCGLPSIRLRS
jgi:trans-aconitate 2-methyltransferase